MTNPNRTEIILIVDRSGSMQGIASDMSGGIQKLIDEQRREPGECLVSLAQFDAPAGLEIVYEARHIGTVPPYYLFPRGGTPLLDAMGGMIERVGARFAALAENERPGKVIVVVITDGEENSSRKFTNEQVKAMVQHQTEAYGWVFIYLGANVDAFANASAMGIAVANSMSYDPDSAGVQNVYAAASRGISTVRSVGASTADFTDEERLKAGGQNAPPTPAP